MQNHSQETIINKINVFFSLNKRKQFFDQYNGGGYCHGLSLLWLYCIDHDQENWFYRTIEQICRANTKKDFNAFEKELEKFIYHVEWLQNSSDYEDGITQSHISDLLQTKVVDNLAYLLTHAQIKTSLKEIFHTNNMISVSGYDHTIGIYRKNGVYLIYDPNYINGKPKECHSIPELKDELLQCLFKLNARILRKFPLTINIIQSKKNKNDRHFFSLHKKIIADKKDINEMGFKGKTNVILAAENGNQDEMNLLLQNGGDPNQLHVHTVPPLILATLNNYPQVIKALLDYHANPNITYFNSYTALMYACHFGFEAATKELLTHNANLLLETKEKQTAMSIAVLQKHWRIVILLLAYVQSIDFLNKQDVELIKTVLPFLRKELAKHPEGFLTSQKNKCQHLFDEIEHHTLERKRTM